MTTEVSIHLLKLITTVYTNEFILFL